MKPPTRPKILLLLVAAVILAAQGTGLCMDFKSLQELNALAFHSIESPADAAAYVKQAAILCGVAGSTFLPDDFDSRLAAAELDAARDPGRLVSDEKVAEAFNFLSDEFRVPHPAQLTGSDILQYRGVMAAIYPHVFSPKSVVGSRPVGALVMLYMLWYSGGITEGVRKSAELDRPPGSLKAVGSESSSRGYPTGTPT